jgi:hypothetical protein
MHSVLNKSSTKELAQPTEVIPYSAGFNWRV